MTSTPAGEPRLEKALENLSRLHPKKIDLSLGRIEGLLAKLGHLERKLPPIIHVAGTNGKGSVTAFLRSILEAAALKVHVYTSPHLVSFRERIRVAGKLIGEEELIEILEECEKANESAPITFFEFTTAAALLAFSRTKADICILEVGLGGRLDATNVIEKPLVTAITPVGLDHKEFLGSDIESVAREKAGIAKKAVPLVVDGQRPEVFKVIEQRAQAKDARFIAQEKNWAVKEKDGRYIFKGLGREIAMPDLPLPGPHQAGNAGTAIACLLAQEVFDISDQAIQRGLENASWPARFQKLNPASFPVRLPEDATIWLDGGHNPLAGEALARALDGDAGAGSPLYVIAGMLKNKDTAGFLRPLAPLADKLFAVPVAGSDAGLPASELSQVAESLGFHAEQAAGVRSALEKIAGPGGRAPQILITGSLHLAGNVLRDIGWQPK